MSFRKKTGKLARTILATVSILAVLGVTPAFALSGNDLVGAGSVWLETTIAVAMVFVTAMAFSLQIARGYFLRTLQKFTLRLGADIWWLAYVLIRDGLIFISFVMGLMVFFPGTFQDYGLAVPFMPVSVVFFGMALITKLYYDADENRNAFRLVTIFVFLGTLLWTFGVIFVTETPTVLNPLPSSVAGNSNIWVYINSTFNSQNNVDLAMVTFYITSAALGVLGLLGFAHPWLHSRVGREAQGLPRRSASPASPVSLPTRAASNFEARPGNAPVGQYAGQVQASTIPFREYVDYIQ